MAQAVDDAVCKALGVSGELPQSCRRGLVAEPSVGAKKGVIHESRESPQATDWRLTFLHYIN